MHGQADNHEKGKSEIIMYYTKTKGEVDTFDQICSNNSCSRMTKRWLMAIFYRIVNAAGVNTSILYHSHMVNQGKKTQTRRRFMKELALEMIQPCAERRIAQPKLPLGVRKSYENDISTTRDRFNITRTRTTAKAQEVQDLPLQQRQEDQTNLHQVPPTCVQGSCHTCAYIALTAILQVRQVASFYSQHGICVVLFVLIANNRVWFVKKTYKHCCDFLQSETIF